MRRLAIHSVQLTSFLRVLSTFNTGIWISDDESASSAFVEAVRLATTALSRFTTLSSSWES